MTGKAPAYQRYPDKWLADTRRLPWAAKGIYADLLDIIWLQYQETCIIPDDDEFIACELGCTLSEWKGAKVSIMHPARPLLIYVQQGETETLVTHGLFSKGLFKEREKQLIYREKQRKNGMKGGRPNTRTDKPRKSSPTPSPSPSPTPSPTAINKKPLEIPLGWCPYTPPPSEPETTTGESENPETKPVSRYLLKALETSLGRKPIANMSGCRTWVNKLISRHDPTEVKKRIDWVFSDSNQGQFAIVVQSGKALWEKWDKIDLAMKRNKSKGSYGRSTLRRD